MLKSVSKREKISKIVKLLKDVFLSNRGEMTLTLDETASDFSVVQKR